MVNHGGFQSVMECIHFGVPMVICPGLRDQPGIAARAAYHGIAYVTSMARVTPESLVGLVEHAMAHGDFRAGIARLQRAIETEAGMQAAVQLIGSTVRQRGASPPACRRD